MKKNKENLKEIKVEDLNKKLATLQENARVIRFKAEGAKSKNVKEPATIRKQIARILTELRARSMQK